MRRLAPVRNANFGAFSSSLDEDTDAENQVTWMFGRGSRAAWKSFESEQLNLPNPDTVHLRTLLNLRAKLKHAPAGQQRGLLAIPGLGFLDKCYTTVVRASHDRPHDHEYFVTSSMYHNRAYKPQTTARRS